MLVVTQKNSEVHSLSSSCTVHEYPIGDHDINGAVAHVHGRYPEQGFVANTEVKEMAYVISGSGKLCFNTIEIILNTGDTVIINPGEKYYWQGDMQLFLACTPAWYPEQHKKYQE